MKAILILLFLSGCAIDSAILQADRICDATTSDKDDYRDCMNKEWQDIKGTAEVLFNRVVQ